MRYEADVISKNIKRKQRIQRILFMILYILLIPTILFSLFLMIIELGNSEEDPSSFGIRMYTVISDSMSPRIGVDDIVLVKSGYEIDSFKKGNIISFYRDGEVITHRIHRIINGDTGLIFVTKGDNNQIEDEERVEYKDIIGKVILIMPNLGAFIAILKNKFFFTLILLALGGIIYYDYRLKQRKKERKLTRERYEKKSDFYF